MQKQFFVIYIAVLLLIFLWWWGQMQAAKYTIECGESIDITAGALVFNHHIKNPWSFSWWDHVGIAFLDYDGYLKIAELFSRKKKPLVIRDWESYLRSTSDSNVVGIRTLKQKLTAESSRRLTEYIYSHSSPHFNDWYIFSWCITRILPDPFKDRECCISYVAKSMRHAGIRLPQKGAKCVSALNIADLSAQHWQSADQNCPYGDEIYVDKKKFSTEYIFF